MINFVRFCPFCHLMTNAYTYATPNKSVIVIDANVGGTEKEKGKNREMAQQGQWQELDQSNSRRSTTATNSTKRQRSIRVREPIRPSLLTCLTPPTTSSAPTLPLCPRHAPGARVLADRGCQVVAAEEAASHHHHWPKVWFGRHPATSHLLTCHTRNINIKIQIQKHKNTKLTKRLVWTTP